MTAFSRLIAFACVALVISACNPPKTTAHQAETPLSPTAAISAGPNPVPAGSGAGTTTIKWTTGDGTDGKVFVSADGAQESEFASGPSGKSDAPIQAGVTYEFRLYNSDHTKELAKITVTYQTSSVISSSSAIRGCQKWLQRSTSAQSSEYNSLTIAFR